MKKIALALATAVVVTLSACGTESTAPLAETESTAPSVSPDVTATEGASEAVADETSAQPTEAATSAAPADAGTRENPYPAGSTVVLGSYEVALGPTVKDATEQVAAENEFNEPPVEGRQFVMVPVTATYTGDESGTAWVDLSIQFVGSGGNTFGTGTDDYCGVIPNDLSDAGEMFAGATAEGNVCVSVPSDQVEGGVWMVEETFSFDGTSAFVGLG